MTRIVDLRSDTLTVPTRGMLAAMASARVGDDVYDEDPTVHALQNTVAELLGHEAALWAPTGSMANWLGLVSSTQPGDEVLCEAGAHIVRAELGSLASLGHVTTRTFSPRQGGQSGDDRCRRY